MGVVGGEGGGEDGGKGRDGAVHKTREAGLDDAQHKALVVVDDVREIAEVGAVGHGCRSVWDDYKSRFLRLRSGRALSACGER